MVFLRSCCCGSGLVHEIIDGTRGSRPRCTSKFEAFSRFVEQPMVLYVSQRYYSRDLGEDTDIPLRPVTTLPRPAPQSTADSTNARAMTSTVKHRAPNGKASNQAQNRSSGHETIRFRAACAKLGKVLWRSLSSSVLSASISPVCARARSTRRRLVVTRFIRPAACFRPNRPQQWAQLFQCKNMVPSPTSGL